MNPNPHEVEFTECPHGDPYDRCETCTAQTRLANVFGTYWDTGIGHNFNANYAPINIGRPANGR